MTHVRCVGSFALVLLLGCGENGNEGVAGAGGSAGSSGGGGASPGGGGRGAGSAGRATATGGAASGRGGAPNGGRNGSMSGGRSGAGTGDAGTPQGGGPGAGRGGSSGTAGAAASGGPACDELPAPTGTVLEVGPDEADDLPGIVREAAAGTTILLADGTYRMTGSGEAARRLQIVADGVTLRGRAQAVEAWIVSLGS